MINMQKSLISIDIITPVYNTSEVFLRQCFDSVFQQTYQNFRLIVVDDGSDDETTLMVLKQYQQKYKDKFLLIFKEHSGIGQTRNIALEKVDADYLVLLDSDDFFETTYLEKLVKPLETKDYDIVYCGYCLYNNAGDKLIKKYLIDDIEKTYDNKYYFYLDGSSKMWKTSLLKSLDCKFSESVLIGGLFFSDKAFAGTSEDLIFRIEGTGYCVRDRDDSVGRSRKTINTATKKQFTVEDFADMLEFLSIKNENIIVLFRYRMLQHMMFFCWLFSCYSDALDRKKLVIEISKFIKDNKFFEFDYMSAKKYLSNSFFSFTLFKFFMFSIYSGTAVVVANIVAFAIRIIYKFK